MSRALVALTSVLAFVALVAVAAALPGHDGGASRPAHHRPALVVAIDPAADPIGLADAATVAGYVHAVQAQQVSDYLHAANDAAVAAYVASLPPIPAPVASSAAPQSVSPQVSAPSGGGCASGGGGNYAVPAYIVQRESGGNYCAANPSGACGAYQIMPGTWAGFGGYASACDAPPAVQDEKARTMGACNWEPPNYCAG